MESGLAPNFLYRNGRICSRRKVRVRAGWIVTARLTESDALYVRDRLEAQAPVWALRGPWAASRLIAPLRRLACLKCGRQIVARRHKYKQYVFIHSEKTLAFLSRYRILRQNFVFNGSGDAETDSRSFGKVSGRHVRKLGIATCLLRLLGTVLRSAIKVARLPRKTAQQAQTS
jgi:hypothetical protein